MHVQQDGSKDLESMTKMIGIVKLMERMIQRNINEELERRGYEISSSDESCEHHHHHEEKKNGGHPDE